MRIAAGMSSAGRPARVRPSTVWTEAVDERREIGGSELVARRMDTGPEERVHRAGADLPQRRDRRLDDARRDAPVAGVDHTDRVVAGDDDGRAVGGDDRQDEAGDAGHDGVGLRCGRAGRGGSARDVHRRAVDLTQPHPFG